MGKRTFMNGAYGRTMRRGGRRGGGDRGIGGGESRPPGFGDLLMWFDAQDTDTYTTDEGGVTSWTDKIAGVVTAASFTARPDPLLNNQYFNGKTAFEFTTIERLKVEGSAEFPTAAISAGDWTFVTAHRKLTGNASARIVDCHSPGATSRIECFHDLSANRLSVQVSAPFDASHGTDEVNLGGMSVGGWGQTGSAEAHVYTREGGREDIAQADTPLAGVDAITLGNRSFGGNNSDTIELAEVLVYDHALTDLEWIAVQSYLDNRYRPADVPRQEGAVAHWDPTDNANISIDAGGVDAYTDKIGGVVLSEATPSQRPTLVQSKRTGHPMLNFVAASSQRLSGATALAEVFRDPNDYTLYAEHVDSGVVAGDRAIFEASEAASPNDEFFRWVQTTDGGINQGKILLRDSLIQRTDLTQTAMDPLAARWSHAGYSGTSSLINTIGGVEQVRPLRDPQPTGLDTISIGGAEVGGNLWDGEIGQLLVFDYHLTTAQKGRVSAFMEDGWTSEIPTRLGAVADWDPTRDDLITLNAGGVEGYEDKIGGYTIGQATPGARPGVVDSIRLGHQALSFDGTQRLSGLVGAVAAFGGGTGATMYAECATDHGVAGHGTLLSANLAADTNHHARLQRLTTERCRFRYGQTVGGHTLCDAFGTVPNLAARWYSGRIQADGDIESKAIHTSADIRAQTGTPPTIDELVLGSTSAAGADQIVAEIGRVLLFSHALNAADSLALDTYIQDQWVAAEVPLRLGADLYADAEDAPGNGTWPTRDPGADFVATGIEAFGTMNGRRTAVFGDQFYTRTDPSADTSRGDHTMAVVMDQVSTGGTIRDFLTHYEAAGTATDNRVSYGYSATDAFSYARANLAPSAFETRNTFSDIVNTTGDRNILIMSFDDTSNAAVAHFNGDGSGDARTNTAAPSLVQDTTRISGRDGGGFEHRGGVAFIAQFGHVMNDADREQLEDYLFDRYFNWAAAEGTGGAVDDILARFKAADYVAAAGDWPSMEGTEHPVTASQPDGGKRPTLLAQNLALGNKPTVEFDSANTEWVKAVGLTPYDGAKASLLYVAVSDSLAATQSALDYSDDQPTKDSYTSLFRTSGAVRTVLLDENVGINNDTTETVGAGDPIVTAAAIDSAIGAVEVVLNGVVQSFAPAAQTITQLQEIHIGTRSSVETQTWLGSIAEAMVVKRKLGLAELVAWQRYADITYLDPDLVA